MGHHLASSALSKQLQKLSWCQHDGTVSISALRLDLGKTVQGRAG